MVFKRYVYNPLLDHYNVTSHDLPSTVFGDEKGDPLLVLLLCVVYDICSSEQHEKYFHQADKKGKI